jgi:hypothetical protein
LLAPEHAARLTQLKKKALASEAERLAVGTGWLPLMLCAVEPEAEEDVAPVADSDKQSGSLASCSPGLFLARRARHTCRARFNSQRPTLPRCEPSLRLGGE